MRHGWPSAVYQRPEHASTICTTNTDYERIEMALHGRGRVPHHGLRHRPGLSVVADSLSAIKYARVKPIRDENGHGGGF